MSPFREGITTEAELRGHYRRPAETTERQRIDHLDDHRLAIPGLAGNYPLDSITNVLHDDAIGLRFVIPGPEEGYAATLGEPGG
ncbi:MAG: hypothetical protein ACXW2C_09765 [Acidimicrobiia bacterium]